MAAVGGPFYLLSTVDHLEEGEGMIVTDSVSPCDSSKPMTGEDGGSAAAVTSYYQGKIEELEILVRDRTHNLQRLKAQRNELNAKVRCG